ncbi:hypothetical protein M422DRAFT_254322 [Sphaerobolus stellatus SS14]|uniref:Uncharacterized protein n=1 Tax=Sphaerobolus stellatus (strain SS14) TaxID=990650 RepID=A0A0C9UHJ9_SPHS4|nr:hypothetical protein M422DRAFT_254322 [Sphaerobolus stellatus SS14]
MSQSLPEFIQGSSTRYEYSRSPTPEEPDSSRNLRNRNPTGKNQYANCPPPRDETVEFLLRKYHRNGVTNRNILSELLKAEHSIQISPSTVARRLRKLGLRASGAMTQALPESTKRQLILNELDKDPTSRKGPPTIKDEIRQNTGIHLTRDYINAEMHVLDPEGFIIGQPGSRKRRRAQLVLLGPHHEWSGDGHDKLSQIGFPIWGIRDVWSGVWLGLWVLPNNRLKVAIGYLYLSLIRELGGMPIQTTTDRGSETGRIFGIAEALREAFSPELEGLPVHRFLQSIHNTTIERGWLQLRLQWGDNVKVVWEEGRDIYDASDEQQ